MYGANALRACAYLLGTLVAAVGGLFFLPRPRSAGNWADRRRSAARRWLGVSGESSPITRRRLALNALTGVPTGLLTLLVIGNFVVGVIGTTAWWAFSPENRPRMWIDVPIDGWGDALLLGILQVVALSAVACLVLPPLARAQNRLLAPSKAERLALRAATLTRTRADVLDAHGAELRRIERDLHDGAQGRLVAMTMHLDLARQAVREEPDTAEALIERAHASAEATLAELREVIRTIYPPILADRGLPGALTAVVARSGVPARLDMDELGDIPAAVETIAYFTVVEALTNAAKHSRASAATVAVEREDDRLRIRITDDGTGGADEARGTGLAGIRRRALALDGEVTVDSPAGGPTTITVELPCGW
ncbi:sensor histidine kinase [Embleya sp. NBC_00888]|uniref:sensor histidine kinase n=1 Tax=Embleya sp. NBC_00888 TaxID=2975960 RepID=UPI0038640FC4|nr:sensor histidine kinase [Embleya sp. NBC_00888]